MRPKSYRHYFFLFSTLAVEALLVVYCVLILLASVSGGQLPSLVRMTHLRTQVLMSFVGGLMLGIALLHLLPHAEEILLSSSKTGMATLGGIVGMFLLLRVFHQHHHHGPVGEDEHADCQHEHHIHNHETHVESAHLHEHEKSSDIGHDNGHEHGDIHEHNAESGKGFGWIGMLLGLWLHTFVDGIALGASAVAETNHGDAWLGLAGLGTFLAVALHKPLDAFAITATMKTSGWSRRHQNMVNAAFSMACPLGALILYFGVKQAGDSELLGWGLAISAGFFICIALSDLLPEVAFHDHDRGKLTLALIVGIALAVAIENLPGHEHSGHEHSAHEHSAHEHDDHVHQKVQQIDEKSKLQAERPTVD